MSLHLLDSYQTFITQARFDSAMTKSLELHAEIEVAELALAYTVQVLRYRHNHNSLGKEVVKLQAEFQSTYSAPPRRYAVLADANLTSSYRRRRRTVRTGVVA